MTSHRPVRQRTSRHRRGPQREGEPPNGANESQHHMPITGTVRWFSVDKGFGFIGREDGPDVFVHYTGIVGQGFRALADNDRVQFEITEGDRGPQAVRVRIVEPIGTPTPR
ncbi:cold shock domain-containing protein [Nocardia sp. NPDC003979]